jgi:WD40 repeat protein
MIHLRIPVWCIALLAVQMPPATCGLRLVPQAGHIGAVMSVVYSPDGHLIASGGLDRTIRLWDATTGNEVRSLVGHEGGVYAVAFSPDGSLLASASDDQTVRIWNVRDGSPLRKLGGNAGAMAAVAFSPSGKQLASGGADGKVRLWNVATGKPEPVLIGHFRAVTSLAFSADGRFLASGSDDATAIIWDPLRLHRLKRLARHLDSVRCVAFDPTGALLATASRDKKVILWSQTSWAPVREFPEHHDAVAAVAFSPNGHSVVSAGLDRCLLWDASSRDAGSIVLGKATAVTSVTWRPGANELACGTFDGKVQTYGAQAGELIRTLSGALRTVSALAYGSGAMLASGGGDGTVWLWDPATGKLVNRFVAHRAAITSLAFSRDGVSLISGSDDRTVRLWNTTTARPLRTYIGHLDSVNCVAISPNGRLIASGSGDRTIRLWDPDTVRPGPVLTGHTGYVTSLAFSPDGKRIASAAGDGTVRLWESPKWRAIGRFPYSKLPVTCVAFNKDGRTLAAGSEDGRVWLREVVGGHRLRALHGHKGAVRSVAFSPDGSILATAGDDHRVVLWQLPDGRHYSALMAHHGRVTAVAFGLDGAQLATAGRDRCVKLWDPVHHAEQASLFAMGSGDYLAITPSGAYTASAGGTGGMALAVGSRAYPLAQFRRQLSKPQLDLAAPWDAMWDAEADLLGLTQQMPLPQTTAVAVAPLVGSLPKVTFTAPTPPSSTPTKEISLRVRATDSRFPIAGVTVTVNGVAIPGSPLRPSTRTKSWETTVPIELTPGENRIQVSTINIKGAESDRAECTTQYVGADPLSELYVVSVGISRYQHPSLSLRYPASDAREVASFFQRRGQEYAAVHAVALVDADATKSAVLQALGSLRAAKPSDTVVVFLASRCFPTASVDYVCATFDSDPSSDAHRGISTRDLAAKLRDVLARRRLLLIDAATANGTTAVQSPVAPIDSSLQASPFLAALGPLQVASVPTISAIGTETAGRVDNAQNGAFATAVLEGLVGLADTNRDRRVTVSELRDYIDATVGRISRGAKVPASLRGSLPGDFFITRGVLNVLSK